MVILPECTMNLHHDVAHSGKIQPELKDIELTLRSSRYMPCR